MNVSSLSPRAPLLRSRHDLLLPPSLHQFKQRANSTHTPLRSEFDPHPCMLGATPTLLYARIQTWRELQPHSYTLGFKNAEQDGRYVYIYMERYRERERYTYGYRDIERTNVCTHACMHIASNKELACTHLHIPAKLCTNIQRYIHTYDRQTNR